MNADKARKLAEQNKPLKCARLYDKIKDSIKKKAMKGETKYYFGFNVNDIEVMAGSNYENSLFYNEVVVKLEKEGFKICPEHSASYGDTAIASGFVLGVYISW